MRKLFLLLLFVVPFLSNAQWERAQLEKDLANFIVANNSADCNALIYYAPKLVFEGMTEAEFLFECDLHKINRIDFMKKTMSPRYIIDTLVISNGSKYAKIRIPNRVEIEFADAEEAVEYHSDSFYYRLVEAYCSEILDRPEIGEIQVDHENHIVYYKYMEPVLAMWEKDHWTFLPQQDPNALSPVDVLDPDILYQ